MPNTIEQGPSKRVESLDLKGLKEIKTSRGGTILVPQYLVPAVMHSILSSEIADEMNVDQAEGGVCLLHKNNLSFTNFVLQPRRLPSYDDAVVAAGRLLADPEPVSSLRMT
jgi:hypothetical protein